MKTKLTAIFRTHHERGQSLVELAISLTVMLLLLSGAVTFGMALFSYVAMRDAAQEGALYGSFNPYLDSNGNGVFDSGEEANVNLAKICQRVKDASNRPINMQAFTCNAGPADPTGNTIGIELTVANKACEGTSGGVSNGVRVQVGYDYPIIMPYIGGIVGSQVIHLRAEVIDTILEPRCP